MCLCALNDKIHSCWTEMEAFCVFVWADYIMPIQTHLLTSKPIITMSSLQSSISVFEPVWNISSRGEANYTCQKYVFCKFLTFLLNYTFAVLKKRIISLLLVKYFTDNVGQTTYTYAKISSPLPKCSKLLHLDAANYCIQLPI